MDKTDATDYIRRYQTASNDIKRGLVMGGAAGTMRRPGGRAARVARARRPAGASARAAVATLAAAGTGGGAAALAWRTAAAVDWRVWTAADAVLACAGIAAAAIALRFLVEVAAALAARARGASAPAWTGRLARGVAAGLAASLLGAGAAHADEPPPSAGWLPADPAPVSVPWAPATRAPSPARIVPAEETRADTGSGPRVHVVEPGESLWSITAEALGATAGAAEVADAWPRLYAANRDTVGSDPDLIHPGLRLALPAALAGDAR